MSPTGLPGGWKLNSYPLGRDILLYGMCTVKDKRPGDIYPMVDKENVQVGYLLGRSSDAGRTSNQCLGFP